MSQSEAVGHKAKETQKQLYEDRARETEAVEEHILTALHHNFFIR